MDWIRTHVFSVQGTYYIWNGFIRTLSWLTIYLGWRVGNGKAIRIGIDPIAGLNSDFVLPMDLKSYLEEFGISSLADAHY